MKTKTSSAKAAERLKKAQKAVEDARKAHRAAFREAVAELFNAWGLRIDADGDQSAHLVITDVQGRFFVGDLPE